MKATVVLPAATEVFTADVLPARIAHMIGHHHAAVVRVVAVAPAGMKASAVHLVAEAAAHTGALPAAMKASAVRPAAAVATAV